MAGRNLIVSFLLKQKVIEQRLKFDEMMSVKLRSAVCIHKSCKILLVNSFPQACTEKY